MTYSMTGYGRGEYQADVAAVVAEIKGVNNRYLEIIPHLPRVLQPLEERIKKFIGQQTKRGKIDVFINFEEKCAGTAIISVDKALGLSYYNSLVALADICGLTPPTDVSQVASYPGVILSEKPELDLDEIWQISVLPALEKAQASFLQMRKTEGEHLAQSIGEKLEQISSDVKKIEKVCPEVVLCYQQKLKERISVLLTQEGLEHLTMDDTRLAMEVALFADKCAIDEEITRLYSHINQFQQALFHTEDAIGRKLDFILQEMNRETNTIGSKANSLTISELVIEIKSELEKIREQIQNIE